MSRQRHSNMKQSLREREASIKGMATIATRRRLVTTHT
uniref:Uncharacterized protein n=1 Tax=Ascaris lumbricoides TaxID=6252 RepID=A0A0M3HNR1_ASCLU